MQQFQFIFPTPTQLLLFLPLVFRIVQGRSCTVGRCVAFVVVAEIVLVLEGEGATIRTRNKAGELLVCARMCMGKSIIVKKLQRLLYCTLVCVYGNLLTCVQGVCVCVQGVCVCTRCVCVCKV